MLIIVQLPLSEKGLKKLSESFRFYKHTLHDEEVRTEGQHMRPGEGECWSSDGNSKGYLARTARQPCVAQPLASSVPEPRHRRVSLGTVLCAAAGGRRHHQHHSEGKEGQQQAGAQGGGASSEFVGRLCLLRSARTCRAALLTLHPEGLRVRQHSSDCTQ